MMTIFIPKVPGFKFSGMITAFHHVTKLCHQIFVSVVSSLIDGEIMWILKLRVFTGIGTKVIFAMSSVEGVQCCLFFLYLIV